MKFPNPQVQAAYALATNGRAIALHESFDYSYEEPIIEKWEAVVTLSRTNLVLSGLSDIALYYKAVKPGHETMMWLGYDSDTIVCRKSEDCDGRDWKERTSALLSEFASTNQSEG